MSEIVENGFGVALWLERKEMEKSVIHVMCQQQTQKQAHDHDRVKYVYQ